MTKEFSLEVKGETLYYSDKHVYIIYNVRTKLYIPMFEPTQDRKINAEIMKQLSGGDRISVRELRERV